MLRYHSGVTDVAHELEKKENKQEHMTAGFILDGNAVFVLLLRMFTSCDKKSRNWTDRMLPRISIIKLFLMKHYLMNILLL